MPIGPYEDFDECVEANQDKDDPEGYCAEIERQQNESSTISGRTHRRTTVNPIERWAAWQATRSYSPTITFRIVQAIQADTAFRVRLAPINTASVDKRVIVDTLGWQDDLLPFMASDSEIGHGDARRVGNLTDFTRETVDGVDMVTATVTFDSDADQGDYFAQLAEEGSFNGVSIHMGQVRFADVIERDGEWVEVTFDEIIEFIETHEDDPDAIDGFFEALHLGAFDAEIAAATQVAIPAFPQAHIIQDSATVVEPVAASAGEPLIAAALLERPPAEWFTNPGLSEPTPLTVTDDGRVYGHLALWDTCHAGFQGQCVRAPRNADYTAFLTARVITDTGERQPVGPLVVDDGHAPASWSNDRVVTYYANTQLAAAYVNVGEDDQGVWVAGAASHKATDAQIETLRRHPLSGDWRPSEDGYRLVAAVSVNAPGLPIPEVLVADGQARGLITYGPTVGEPLFATLEESESDLVLVAEAIERLFAGVSDQIAALRTELVERPAVDSEADLLLAELSVPAE